MSSRTSSSLGFVMGPPAGERSYFDTPPTRSILPHEASSQRSARAERRRPSDRRRRRAVNEGNHASDGWSFRTYEPGSPQWQAYHERIVGLTYDQTQRLRKEYLEERPLAMTISEAMDYCSDIVDESDPDLVG